MAVSAKGILCGEGLAEARVLSARKAEEMKEICILTGARLAYLIVREENRDLAMLLLSLSGRRALYMSSLTHNFWTAIDVCKPDSV